MELIFYMFTNPYLRIGGVCTA